MTVSEYSSSEHVEPGDYHFCQMVSNSMPCQIVCEMFVQYALLFIMTLSEYVPISFVRKCQARWLSLLWENNDRWTQDKHLASCPMQLIIWHIHSNDRSPRCASPHVRCMISIDARMHCPSITWTSSIWFKCTITLESGVLHWFYWLLPTYNHFPSFVHWPFIQCQSSRTPVMSLASWYDSIPFHFRILVFPLRRWFIMMHGTDATLHASCASLRDRERVRCLIFVKSLLLATPLFGNV